MNKFKVAIAIVFLFCLITEVETSFAEDFDREDVYSTLEKAFDQQVEISEKARLKAEIKEKLKPYFTKGFINKFIKENVVKVEGGYATLGSDSAANYIPFFTYNDRTTIKRDHDQEKFIVSENFTDYLEGPLVYGDHIETVVLIKESGKWKVNEIIIDDK